VVVGGVAEVVVGCGLTPTPPSKPARVGIVVASTPMRLWLSDAYDDVFSAPAPAPAPAATPAPVGVAPALEALGVAAPAPANCLRGAGAPMPNTSRFNTAVVSV